jgi:hypothetical protein
LFFFCLSCWIPCRDGYGKQKHKKTKTTKQKNTLYVYVSLYVKKTFRYTHDYIHIYIYICIFLLIPIDSYWFLLIPIDSIEYMYECCSYEWAYDEWAMWAYECGSYVVYMKLWSCSYVSIWMRGPWVQTTPSRGVGDHRCWAAHPSHEKKKASNTLDKKQKNTEQNNLAC